MLILDAMEEYCLDCKIKRYSPRTVKNYRELIKLLTRWLEEECKITELEAIRPTHLKRFVLVQEEKGRKPHYINDLLKTYKVFLKYCVQEGYLKDNPAGKIAWVKQPKVLIRSFNSTEIKGLVSFYDGKDYLSVRNKTMLAVFFDTGMRLNEVLTLTREQIMEERILVHGKGNKERMVPLSPFLSKQLLKYIRLRDVFFGEKMTVEPYVFLSRTGHKMTPEAVRKFMLIAAKAVGVRP